MRSLAAALSRPRSSLPGGRRRRRRPTAASADHVGRSAAVPERGFVIDLPQARGHGRRVRVHENGVRRGRCSSTPLASDVSSATMLAIDASDSMARRAAEPVRVRRARRSSRSAAANQEVGLITFNGNVHVLSRRRSSPASSRARWPRAAARLRHAHLRRGRPLAQHCSAARGSRPARSSSCPTEPTSAAPTIEAVVARGAGSTVRVFTVGLRSGAFDPAPLAPDRATQTGGVVRRGELGSRSWRAIYAGSERRLARSTSWYRSLAAPSIARRRRGRPRRRRHGDDAATRRRRSRGSRRITAVGERFCPLERLVAPARARRAGLIALRHRRSLVAAAPGRRIVVSRVNEFVTARTARRPSRLSACASRDPRGASAQPPPTRLVGRARRAARHRPDQLSVDADHRVTTVAGRSLVGRPGSVVLDRLRDSRALRSPLVAHAVIVRARSSAVRERVRRPAARQPPGARFGLRAGYSFLGAFVVVVENAAEPSKSEFQRVDHRRAARRSARGCVATRRRSGWRAATSNRSRCSRSSCARPAGTPPRCST